MKTLITEVTLQENQLQGKNGETLFYVFVTYCKNKQEYFGFNVFDNVLDAMESAENSCKTWTCDFMSIVTKYRYTTIVGNFKSEVIIEDEFFSINTKN